MLTMMSSDHKTKIDLRVGRMFSDPLKTPSLSGKDRRYLKMARRAAARSNFHKKQVGVVLVKGNKVLVEAHNHLSHPRYLKFPGIDGLKYWSLHAEICALSQAGDLRKTTAYLFGFKNGRPGNSKPCPLCDKYLRLRKVRRVVHTTPFGGVSEISY